MAEVKVVAQGLLERKVRPIQNWHEWLGHWNEAVSVEEMLGLLHYGFNVSLRSYKYGEPEYDGIDRLGTYFLIADGWSDSEQLENHEDRDQKYEMGFDKNGYRIMKSVSELRQQVARKAFDMLCHNFFKPRSLLESNSDQYEADWENVTSSRVLPVIRAFFELERTRFGDRAMVRNLPYLSMGYERREYQVAVDFLLALARFTWGWEQREIPTWRGSEDQKIIVKYNQETQERLDSAKPWLVGILSYLDRLDLLRPWMTQLDEPCVAKLKEIALRVELSNYRHPVKEDRLVATVEEACYVGSVSGLFLKHRELMLRESTRLTAILEAEQEAEDATRKLKKLTGK